MFTQTHVSLDYISFGYLQIMYPRDSLPFAKIKEKYIGHNISQIHKHKINKHKIAQKFMIVRHPSIQHIKENKTIISYIGVGPGFSSIKRKLTKNNIKLKRKYM